MIDDVLALTFSDEWNTRFLGLADYLAQWSKDPSTKVGCVVVGPDKEIRSTGFNGFPRGIADDCRLDDRQQKYPIMCHAEENAITHAARIGVSLKGCVAFITHPPCCRCATSIIQAGIKRVVFNSVNIDRWQTEFEVAENLLEEAGVIVWRIQNVRG